MTGLEEKQAVLVICDLMNSSVLADHLPLHDYVSLLRSWQSIGCSTARSYLEKHGYAESEFELSYGGDEVRLFLYSSDSQRDITIALQFAVAFKLIWAAGDFNSRRFEEGKSFEDIAVGIHLGKVAFVEEVGRIEGYAINLAKRLEGMARDGHHYRIMVSHPYMTESSRIYGHLFTERKYHTLKGITDPVAVYELRSYFTRSLFREWPSSADVDATMEKIIGSLDHFQRKAWITTATITYLFFRGNHQRALDIGLKALALDKSDPSLLFAMARAHSELGKIEEAIAWIKKAIEADEHDSVAHSYLGDCLFKAGRLEEALMAYETAALLSPENSYKYRHDRIAEIRGKLSTGTHNRGIAENT